MVFVLVAALLAGAEVQVSMKEPAVPVRQSMDFSVVCAGATLRLSGFGVNRPNGKARVELDGRSVGGMDRLTLFMTDPAAAYRVSARCPGSPDRFLLRVHRGLPGSGDGQFAVMTLQIDANGAAALSGEEVGSAEGFWFR